MNSNFTAEELKLAELLLDEVKWAQAELGWVARWYQAEILHAQKTRTVLRCGRRVGKTDVACVRILNRALTKPGRSHDESYVILILTPFETQITLIFKRLREMLNKSLMLKASLVGDTQNPQELRFANGSRITGFTTGARSGNGAANVRGQRADFIYIDEVDYIGDSEINTVMAIVLEDPDRIEVLTSSTPSGRRSHFYRWCTNKNLGWKEFHFPSWVNPTWSEQTETEFRASLSELSYKHEVEADFGEEQEGVYAKKYLDLSYERAINFQYTAYPDTPYAATGPRVIGIDWDKYQATPVFVGIEWHEPWKLFRVFLREEMPKTEFTLDFAVERIVHLQRMWKFDWLVADRGYGEFQIETLRKYGLHHPETGLAERIVDITFSDKLEIRDPFTKQLEKKHLKPFAVNTAVVAFERQQLVLCPTDSRMRKQLEDYHVVSVSQSGAPVYVDENEHMVDALNLAMMQMTLKYSDLFKTNFASRMITLQHNPTAPIVRPMEATTPKLKIRAVGNTGSQPFAPRRRTSGFDPRNGFRTLL
jgi:hypothetical protein